MKRTPKKKREEARRLFLTNECETNAEIARRVGLKPHTVAKYREEEQWDDLKLKSNRHAAEQMALQVSNDRVSLNLRHYQYYEVALVELANTLKGKGKLSVREVHEVMASIEKAQRGQRLSKGVGVDQEAEELIRAEAQAEIHRLIDVFVQVVKENVSDEAARDRIRQAVIAALPDEPPDGPGGGKNSLPH